MLQMPRTYDQARSNGGQKGNITRVKLALDTKDSDDH